MYLFGGCAALDHQEIISLGAACSGSLQLGGRPLIRSGLISSWPEIGRDALNVICWHIGSRLPEHNQCDFFGLITLILKEMSVRLMGCRCGVDSMNSTGHSKQAIYISRNAGDTAVCSPGSLKPEVVFPKPPPANTNYFEMGRNKRLTNVHLLLFQTSLWCRKGS